MEDLKGLLLLPFGSGVSKAQQSGATFGKSLGYGALSSAIETGTESLFGLGDIWNGAWRCF